MMVKEFVEVGKSGLGNYYGIVTLIRFLESNNYYLSLECHSSETGVKVTEKFVEAWKDLFGSNESEPIPQSKRMSLGDMLKEFE